ncbi:hypothetical protein M758_2G162500 [Ceratodon purpureus]|nr:hypothetical protein M758_2G162500 [Ceratodon purpureus]
MSVIRLCVLLASMANVLNMELDFSKKLSIWMVLDDINLIMLRLVAGHRSVQFNSVVVEKSFGCFSV